MTSEEADLETAGLGARSLAAACDLVLLTASFALLAASVVARAPSTGALAAVGLMWPLCVVLYEAALRGETLGRRLTGLKLIAASDGGAPSFLSAGLRTAAAFVSALPLGAGYWWALFDAEGRCWHDRWSGTAVVVDARPRGARARRLQALGLALIVGWTAYAAAARLAAAAADDMARVRAGRDALAALSGLEELHRQRHGAYTGDLDELFGEAELPGSLLEALRLAVDGPTLAVELTGNGYVVKARARDVRRTWVEVRGPRK